MKNKSLIALVIASVLILGGLVFSVFKFVKKESLTFYADGYVSVNDFESSDKIYFTKGSLYKKAYNNNVAFKSKDNEKMEVSKYNFVLYQDKSISFLTDGVLMDLNKANETFIPYYNIKSNYLINYTSGKYVIHATDKDIVLDNFLGRISDDKIIVAGNDIRLKLSSSEDFISGYYFEIIFGDGNIIKINNDEVSLETISDESYILVGDHIKIDLAHQAIFYDDEAKISLSEIVVDNNSNIDIKYEDIFSGGSGDGDGDGQGGGSGKEEEGNNTVNETVNNTVPDYRVETVVDYKKVPYVELLESSSNAHKIELGFKVNDDASLITGPVKVRLLNIQTGEVSVKEYANYFGKLDYIADNLMSNSSYMVTIYASYTRDGAIFPDYSMFQRSFNTTDIGVSLDRDYLTSDSIGFKVLLDKNATFLGADLNLYDGKGNLIDTIAFENNGQDLDLLFSGLNSNTNYTAKVENINYGTVKYTTGDAALMTLSTLKYNPFTDSLLVTSPTAVINKKDYNVKFTLGKIDDRNKAIKEVRYDIYEKETGNVVKQIKKSDINSFEVAFEEELKPFTTYYYKAIITLNDGEKTIEVESLNSNDFNMNSKISPTMQFVSTDISASSIAGYFVILDPDNALDTQKNIYVDYISTLGENSQQALEFAACPKEEASTTKCAYMSLEGLKSNDVYTINLFGFVDLKSEDVPADYALIGAIKLNTEKADIILTDMTAYDLDEVESLDKVFEISLGLLLADDTQQELKTTLNGFDIVLYEGFDTTGMYLSTMHLTDEEARSLFEEKKNITIKDFGYSLEQLQKLHISDNKMSKKYSIRLRSAKAGNAYVEFKSDVLNFEINDVLLGLTDAGATIKVTPILNNNSNSHYNKDLNTDTVIGLQVTTEFANKPYALKVNFKAYDLTDEDNITSEDLYYEVDLKDGSPAPVFDIYFTDTPFFKRGRSYKLSYTVSLDLNDDGSSDLEYPFSPDNISEIMPVESENIDIPKQRPEMILFPWTSDNESVTYKYQVKDIDNALKEDYKVYYAVLEQEYEGQKQDQCPNNTSGYKTNFTCVKFGGLNNKDRFNVYLKAYLYEKKEADFVVININDFSFESIYNNLDDITFTLETSDDKTSLYTNILAMKISENYDALDEEAKASSEELKKRVAYYTLQLQGENNTKFVINNINNVNRTSSPFSSNIIEYYENNRVKTAWNGSNKDDAKLRRVAYIDKCISSEGTCLYLDYSLLYNSKTFKDAFAPYKNANITASLSATYDTGKIGYFASNNKNYVFQVKSNEVIENGRIFNDLYMQTIGSRYTATVFNNEALGSAYAYLTASRFGFVDDTLLYDLNSPTGKMTFANLVFTNLSTTTSNLGSNYFDMDYIITRRGVEIKPTSVNTNLPIIAKELGKSPINGDGQFIFDKVVPAINVLSRSLTVNGMKVRFSISGLADEDVKDEDGKKFMYLEVYNKEDDSLVKTLKINKEELENRSGVIKDGKFVLSKDDDYKFDILSVSVDGKAVSSYQYNYLNDTFTFSKDDEGKSIYVTYRLVIDDLQVDTSYYLKSYMYMGKNGKKTYLVDVSSPTYADFAYNFKTKAINEVAITDGKFSVESLSDYKTRYLTTTYNIDDIYGFNDFSYEICSEDGSVCTSVQKEVEEGCYNTFGNTCINKNTSNYNLNVVYDISLTDNFDFKYESKYNLVIKGKVKENGSINEYEIYNNKLNVRALENPTINVVKNSKHTSSVNASGQNIDNYYITFDVSVNDPDRVIINPKAGDKQNGYYVAYLAQGPERKKVTENIKDKDGNALASEQMIGVTSDGKDITRRLSYGFLDADSEYYLIIEYRTYRNNTSVSSKPERFGIPYLIYTLDDNNISVGMIDYTALGTSTVLKFGYATNITQDFIKNESGALVPDPEQEAYVAGISYVVRRTSGDDTFMLSDSVIFNPGDVIYVTDDDKDSKVGESYYQITLNNTTYPAQTFYGITFKFFLGGNISAHLTSEEACKNAGISNYWNSDKNECYILGETTYSATTLYGGVK